MESWKLFYRHHNRVYTYLPTFIQAFICEAKILVTRKLFLNPGGSVIVHPEVVCATREALRKEDTTRIC